MFKKHKIALILAMGGKGIRFGANIPKQLHYLAGKKIYLHTLEAFLKTNFFDEIILVCHKDTIEEIQNDVKAWPSIKIVEGGETRQLSVYNGLKNTSADIVVIHDAVRPFVTEDIIIRNLEAVLKYNAVNTTIKVTDTIAIVEHGKITSIPNRDNCIRGQTPQTFSRKLILQAHELALKNNLFNSSDDCNLIIKAGFDVYTVEGSEENIKITNQLDVFLAEQIIYARCQKSLENKPQSLEKKTFVVIGATGGIGKAICSQLEIEKAIVIPISRTTSPFSVDIKNYEQLKNTLQNIYEKYGKLDGLINSAGFLLAKPLAYMEKEEIDHTIDVNLKGLIYACKHAKIKNNGHIINIASSSFNRGRKETGVYSSTKAAVVNFTQALAEEFSHLKINVITPQRTNTPMRLKNFPNEDVKELLSPEKIAQTVINLLKDQNTTGSIIEVRRDEA